MMFHVLVASALVGGMNDRYVVLYWCLFECYNNLPSICGCKDMK